MDSTVRAKDLTSSWEDEMYAGRATLIVWYATIEETHKINVLITVLGAAVSCRNTTQCKLLIEHEQRSAGEERIRK